MSLITFKLDCREAKLNIYQNKMALPSESEIIHSPRRLKIDSRSDFSLCKSEHFTPVLFFGSKISFSKI